MTSDHCPGCVCRKQAPDYPVTCRFCGITYGPGGEVSTHAPTMCESRLDRKSGPDYVPTRGIDPAGGK